MVTFIYNFNFLLLFFYRINREIYALSFWLKLWLCINCSFWFFQFKLLGNNWFENFKRLHNIQFWNFCSSLSNNSTKDVQLRQFFRLFKWWTSSHFRHCHWRSFVVMFHIYNNIILFYFEFYIQIKIIKNII